ncbi:TPR domain protein in aerotolerance operon [Legionella lansingensis]|uniref:TPR repeat containing protein n=1 Tax=Legionella lansingensis TaxID=45067 RepID=A0A0W0VRM2_9GAMM|nr:tetratricopeptide repeat protein [Legionella lansingensis]KTD22737.1 TPR repeat containing protein [Legionella lansingensis]SNV56730.1 TPR domain protein in aerotolerance operon [Legionella lansingensis]
MKLGWLLLLMSLSLKAFSFSWQDLWSTKDQQAQTLMTQGKFKEAEETFQHHEWRAAAAYRAGNYEQAANDYRSMQNERGYYNEGNALAQLGQYQQAMQAYDKALALNPNNKDAQHNRKIVAELLKKEQQKQKPNNQQNKEEENKQDQEAKDQQNNDQKNNSQQSKSQEAQGQKKNQQTQDEQQNQSGKQQQDKAQARQDEQQDKKQQDERNVNKESDKQKQEKAGQTGKHEDAQKGEKTNPAGAESAAEREKQQAKEQWLKLIPDDPGGLLREKFLRDHIRRQRGWYQ